MRTPTAFSPMPTLHADRVTIVSIAVRLVPTLPAQCLNSSHPISHRTRSLIKADYQINDRPNKWSVMLPPADR